MKSRSLPRLAVAVVLAVGATWLPASVGSIAFGDDYAPYVAGPVIHSSDLYAPYVDTYAPYVAGPVIHSSDLYAPYVDTYAPYVAGPVIHSSDLR